MIYHSDMDELEDFGDGKIRYNNISYEEMESLIKEGLITKEEFNNLLENGFLKKDDLEIVMMQGN